MGQSDPLAVALVYHSIDPSIACFLGVTCISTCSCNRPPVVSCCISPSVSCFAGALSNLQQHAKHEGFLDSILGTNCYSNAVEKLGRRCSSLDQDLKYRLALDLLNCHQHHLGGHVYVCKQDTSLQQCLAGMSDRDHGAYMEFLTNVDRYEA